MNSVKDFTIGQRVAADLGDGTVSKIGRVYVYVDIDGGKTEKLTPADLRELAPADEIPTVEDEPLVIVAEDEVHAMPIVLDGPTRLAGQLDNAAPVGGRPPMRLKGKRADADARRAARKAQRNSRKKNRTR
jgi:hypothetical protein